MDMQRFRCLIATIAQCNYVLAFAYAPSGRKKLILKKFTSFVTYKRCSPALLSML
jgi:hypothetical protein